MKNRRFSQRLSSLLLALLLILPLSGCGVQLLPADEPVGSADQGTPAAPEQPTPPPAEDLTQEDPPEPDQPSLPEDGWYSSKEEVALYLHLYGQLPDNFITKAEAQAAKEALAKATAKAQKFQDALSDANASAQTAEEEHARLLRELEELRNRPAEADTAAVDAARKAAIEEMTEKINKAKDAKKQAEDKRKTAEEALAAAQRELDELKAKEPEVRELTQEEKDALTAEAVNQAKAEGAEQIRNLEKKLAAADPNVAEFKVLFTSWQETHGKMMEALEQIAQADAERAAKLRQAVKAALEQMGGDAT